jgi:hypothetical protein
MSNRTAASIGPRESDRANATGSYNDRGDHDRRGCDHDRTGCNDHGPIGLASAIGTAVPAWPAAALGMGAGNAGHGADNQSRRKKILHVFSLSGPLSGARKIGLRIR